MSGIYLMENQLQHYAWGSRTAIASLTKRPTPSLEPEAELWMGAHPKAPSSVYIDGQKHSLLDLIEADPEQWLSASFMRRNVTVSDINNLTKVRGFSVDDLGKVANIKFAKFDILEESLSLNSYVPSSKT